MNKGNKSLLCKGLITAMPKLISLSIESLALGPIPFDTSACSSGPGPGAGGLLFRSRICFKQQHQRLPIAIRRSCLGFASAGTLDINHPCWSRAIPQTSQKNPLHLVAPNLL